MAEVVRLKAGREVSLRRRHPWVFSGALAGPVRAAAGDTVALRSADDAFLAWAALRPGADLVARVWTFDEAETVDAAFVARRVEAAAARRVRLAERTDAVRLVFAEADGLPGVVVDRYGDWVVVELTSVGAERWRDAVVGACAALPGVRGVYERSDNDGRKREGLPRRSGPVAGEAPPELVTITEDGRSYAVDVRRGHKTGFYLDQRDNRRLVQQLAADRRVLDLCSYTGGFAVAALAGGASSVTSVDSSGPALAAAAGNVAATGRADRWEGRDADVFAEVRALARAGERFDLVVCDPPKLAATHRDAQRAARAYKDLNLWSLRLLGPGGVLVTCTCSGAIDTNLFRKIVFGAAIDADVDAVVTHDLRQATDHPEPLTFPEALYLHGLALEVR